MDPSCDPFDGSDGFPTTRFTHISFDLLIAPILDRLPILIHTVACRRPRPLDEHRPRHGSLNHHHMRPEQARITHLARLPHSRSHLHLRAEPALITHSSSAQSMSRPLHLTHFCLRGASVPHLHHLAHTHIARSDPSSCRPVLASRNRRLVACATEHLPSFASIFHQ